MRLLKIILLTASLGQAAALSDATPNPTVVGQGAFCLYYNGTTWDRCRGTVTYGLAVDITRFPAGGLSVAGTTAHDAAWGSLNPVGIGGYASATAPSDVSADGEVVRSWMLRSGALVQQPSYSGVLASTGNGAAGTGTLRVAIASDNIAYGVNLAQYTPVSGRLPVDGSGVTQPISGTVTANQSGTWTVQPGNTANTTAWLVAGGKTNNNAAPGATNLGILPAVANAATQTWTEGNQVALSTDLSGRTRIDNSSWIGSTAPTVGSKTSSNSIPVVVASDQGAIAVTPAANSSVNLSQVAGNSVVTSGTGILKVGITGNAGAAIDAANNSSAPANVVVPGYETATQTSTQPTAATAGNVRRPVMSTDGATYVRNGGPVNWSCDLNAIGTTLTQCQAAPGAGLRLYITNIVAQSNTATDGLWTIRFGTGTNCGTGTGNLLFGSASALVCAPRNTTLPVVMPFNTPISVTAANAVCVLGVVTNTTNIHIDGYTAP